MKVLIINNFVRHGSGIDAGAELERRVLEARGHEVRTFGRDNREFDEATPARKIALFASCIYSLSTRRDLERLLAKERFDVVHLKNLVPLLTGSVYDACRAQGVPTVQHLHNYRAFCLSSYSYRDDKPCDLCWPTAFTSCVAFRCYRSSVVQSASLTAARLVDTCKGRRNGYDADLYIANSAHTKREHVCHGMDPAQIKVAHNATDDLRCVLSAERHGQATRPRRRLTFVGALISPKGVWRLLDLAEALPEFVIDVIGEGSESDALRDDAKRRRLDNVAFHGFRAGAEKADLWADSFLTVVPSLWGEPFGLIVPESYSLGIPVVTTGSGGIAEIVSDGETGLVRSFDDPREIAALIRELWLDESRYGRMRSAVRSAYDERFTEAAYGAQVEELLEEAIETVAGAAPVAHREPPPPGLVTDIAKKPWQAPSDVELRVLIDGHMLGAGETGNETYIRGLLQGFESIGCRHSVVVHDRQVEIGDHTPVTLRYTSDWARVFTGLSSLARSTDASVIHSTYILPPRVSCARVVTIHDLSFMRHPEMFTRRDRLLLTWGVPLAVRGADQIIVPSAHARDDLFEIFGVSPDRVRVTHEGVSDRFRVDAFDRSRTADGRQSDRLPSFPYVLTVGNLQPRKNPQRLLTAWAELVGEGLTGECRLVLAGGSHGRQEDVRSFIAKLRLQDHVLLTGYVGDDELPALYAGARAFVFPSLYEGFGLPVLEAMASGVPVACSDLTSLPEVAGSAAALFDPFDVDDIAGRIAALIGDEELRRELIARGLQRVTMFSWEKCARETLGVYRRAAERYAQRRDHPPAVTDGPGHVTWQVGP